MSTESIIGSSIGTTSTATSRVYLLLLDREDWFNKRATLVSTKSDEVSRGCCVRSSQTIVSQVPKSMHLELGT